MNKTTITSEELFEAFKNLPEDEQCILEGYSFYAPVTAEVYLKTLVQYLPRKNSQCLD